MGFKRNETKTSPNSHYYRVNEYVNMTAIIVNSLRYGMNQCSHFIARDAYNKSYFIPLFKAEYTTIQDTSLSDVNIGGIKELTHFYKLYIETSILKDIQGLIEMLDRWRYGRTMGIGLKDCCLFSKYNQQWKFGGYIIPSTTVVSVKGGDYDGTDVIEIILRTSNIYPLDNTSNEYKEILKTFFPEKTPQYEDVNDKQYENTKYENESINTNFKPMGRDFDSCPPPPIPKQDLPQEVDFDPKKYIVPNQKTEFIQSIINEKLNELIFEDIIDIEHIAHQIQFKSDNILYVTNTSTKEDLMYEVLYVWNYGVWQLKFENVSPKKDTSILTRLFKGFKKFLP